LTFLSYKPKKNNRNRREIDFDFFTSSTMDDFFVAILSTLLIAALIPLYLWKRHRDSQSSSSSSSEESHQVCNSQSKTLISSHFSINCEWIIRLRSENLLHVPPLLAACVGEPLRLVLALHQLRLQHNKVYSSFWFHFIYVWYCMIMFDDGLE